MSNAEKQQILADLNNHTKQIEKFLVKKPLKPTEIPAGMTEKDLKELKKLQRKKRKLLSRLKEIRKTEA